MYYDFAVHPLVYVAAALAIFGGPMLCIFLAAMRGHSPKPAQQPAKSLVAQASLPVAVMQQPKSVKYTRKRALRVEWVSLPVERR